MNQAAGGSLYSQPDDAFVAQAKSTHVGAGGTPGLGQRRRDAADRGLISGGSAGE
ncbi:MAG: hypothetical protein ACT4TC_25980 [Myxococcaceae bacterium]